MALTGTAAQRWRINHSLLLSEPLLASSLVTQASASARGKPVPPSPARQAWLSTTGSRVLLDHHPGGFLVQLSSESFSDGVALNYTCGLLKMVGLSPGLLNGLIEQLVIACRPLCFCFCVFNIGTVTGPASGPASWDGICSKRCAKGVC